MSFFYRHYACISGLITYTCITDPESALPACVRGLSLATYAHAENLAQISIEAKRYYVSALEKTNAALASPDRAARDSTLLAVMMLTNFETMMKNKDQHYSSEAWSAHVRGSAALLALRSTNQFRTNDGRLLFFQASMHLVSNCLRTAHRIPAQVHSLTEEAAKWPGKSSMETEVWIVHRARLKMADLYSDIASGHVEDPVTAVHEALSLEEDLTCSSERGLPACRFISTEQVSLRPWLAIQAWTSASICRIVLHLLVLKLLSSFKDVFTADTSMDLKALNQASACTIEELQSAVLTKTPRLARSPRQKDKLSKTDLRLYRLLSTPEVASDAISGVADQVLIASLCGSSFLTQSPISPSTDVSWALILIGHVFNPSFYFRESAPQLFRFFGRALGMQQALKLADSLDEDPP